jgi:hypothetical protein
MEINEARGHDEPISINHLLPIVVVEFPDFGDLTVFDADIGLVTRDPCSVNNGSAFHNSIELWHSYPPF